MLSRQCISRYSRKLGPAPPASSILQSSAFLNPLLAPASTTIRTINWTKETRRRRSSELEQQIASKFISQLNDPSTIGDEARRKAKLDEVETERSKWRRRLKSRKRAAELDQIGSNMSLDELHQLKFRIPKSPTTPDASPLQTDNVSNNALDDALANVFSTPGPPETLPSPAFRRASRLSEALRIPALPDQVIINKDLTIDFNANVNELQSQIRKMQGLFERASDSAQGLLWKRWTSSNPEVLRSWLKIFVFRWQTRGSEMSAETHEAKDAPEPTQPAVSPHEHDEESPRSGKPAAMNIKDRRTEALLANMYEAGGMTFMLNEPPQLAGASGPTMESMGDGNSGTDSLLTETVDQQRSMTERVPASSEKPSADEKNEGVSLEKSTGEQQNLMTERVVSPEGSSTDTSLTEPTTDTSPEEASADNSLEKSTTHTSPEKPSVDGTNETRPLSKRARKKMRQKAEHMLTSPKEASTDASLTESSTDISPKQASTDTSPEEASADTSPEKPTTHTSPEKPSVDGTSETAPLSKRARKKMRQKAEHVLTSHKEASMDNIPKESSMDTPSQKPLADENSDKDSLSVDTADRQRSTMEHVTASPKESSTDTADGTNEMGSLPKSAEKQKKKKKNKKNKLVTEEGTGQDLLSRPSRPDLDRPASPASLTEGPSPAPTATQNPPLPTALPHLTSTGTAHMVSVSAKPHTVRTATAVGVVCFTNPTPLSLIRSNALKKGDVLSVSRIAGIMAAKKCPDLIPLCHPIALTHVGIEVKAFGPDDTALSSASETVGEHGGVVVEATVQCTGPTGVEMEALMAVMGAALTVVDMCKAVDKFQRVERVRVVRKEGGKSGTWNEEGWKSCM
jgi:molybdenum cofactor biosynthesis protein MoaC